MKKVLIVDDERDIREIVARKLSKIGYSVQTAANGEEALTLCKSDTFDLILMDIVMPKMDGYETCQRLQKEPQASKTPILLLTTKELDPQGLSKRYAELGVTGYIAKPSDFNEILKKIKEIIGEV